MTLDQIEVGTDRADARWAMGQVQKECSHFHAVELEDILLWSNAPHLGPWCKECDPAVVKVDLENAARAIGARLAAGVMAAVKAYFDTPNRGGDE